MRVSTDRILTTHVGSLPRSQAVIDLLFAQDRGDPYDQEQFEQVMSSAVEEAVKSQAEVGIDVASDGEMSKISYATYVRHRLTGLDYDSTPPIPQDIEDIPEYRVWWIARALGRMLRPGSETVPRLPDASFTSYRRPTCKGPIGVKDLAPVERDIARLKAALSGRNVVEGFLNSVSPGTIAVFQPNDYYPSHEAYLDALANAMRQEYEMIVNAGLLLQVDCPDLAMGRHTRYRDLSDQEFLRYAELHVEALNHALANVPADRVRMHVCWGNYEGPHINDIDSTKILPIVLKAKPMALLMEGANPRHEHEWEAWTKIKLPDDKVLVPGVIASSINYVEHPEVVAQRILRYASIVGRERVIAGSDCGFGPFAGFGFVFPSLCWMKFRALAEGARLASEKLARARTTASAVSREAVRTS
jgi:5-methyltetrahydropteroyltriglutamate--homocysteine methyltransferase